MSVSDKYLGTLPEDQVVDYKLLAASDMTTFEKLLIIKLTAIEERLEAIEEEIEGKTLNVNIKENNQPISIE